MSQENHVTVAIARFIAMSTHGEVPDAVREQAVHHLADTVGAALVGSTQPATRAVIGAIEVSGGLAAGNFPVWGTSWRATLLDSCLANGVAAHTLELDDTVHPGPLHPSGAVAPVAFGFGQVTGASGSAILTAYALGIEVTARLSAMMNPHIYQSGWHSTGPLGAFGAFAAGAHLLGLSQDQVVHGLGTTASLASGIRRNTGTMTKPLHSGNASRSGALAALLAARDYTSREGAFDGELGIMAVMGAPEDAADRLADASGPWELEGHEAWGLKAYPCCGEATSIIEAAVIALGDTPIDEVTSVLIRTGPRGKRILRYPDPADLEQARFSAHYLCALALVDGDVTLDNLTESRVDDRDVRAVWARVTHQEEPVDTDLGIYGAAVELGLRDGTTSRAEIVEPRGWGDRSLTRNELETKFLSCAHGVLDDADARTLFERLMNIDTADRWDERVLAHAVHDPA